MALNDTTKTSIAFKKLISKDHRYTSNEWYEETDGGGFNVHSNNVWQEAIPGTPPGATSAVVKCYIDGIDGAFKLTQDSSIPNSRGWYADSSGTRIADWIPPKYGQLYTVKLYQDNGSGTAKGSQIFTTDAMDWFWDYERGYLAIQDTHAYTTPFWVEGYSYIGNKQGVQSIAAGTNTPIVGNAKLAAGSNVALSQSGTTITISSTATGGSGTTKINQLFAANGPYRVDTEVDGARVMTSNGTISAVYLWRGTAGVSGTSIVDLNKNGTTMYSTQANRPTLLYNDADKTVQATLPDITTFSAGDRLTMDIDAVDSGKPYNLMLIIETQ